MSGKRGMKEIMAEQPARFRKQRKKAGFPKRIARKALRAGLPAALAVATAGYLQARNRLDAKTTEAGILHRDLGGERARSSRLQLSIEGHVAKQREMEKAQRESEALRRVFDRAFELSNARHEASVLMRTMNRRGLTEQELMRAGTVLGVLHATNEMRNLTETAARKREQEETKQILQRFRTALGKRGLTHSLRRLPPEVGF